MDEFRISDMVPFSSLNSARGVPTANHELLYFIQDVFSEVRPSEGFCDTGLVHSPRRLRIIPMISAANGRLELLPRGARIAPPPPKASVCNRTKAEVRLYSY